MSRPAPWHFADLLDFETLLAGDAAQSDDALLARDRAIRIHSTERSAAFREWLDARRKQESSALPGEALRAGWDALLVLGALGGLLLGASVCAAVLRYPGSEPVNVSVFLGATLGPQFIVPLIFAALWWLLRVRVGARALGALVCWLGGLVRHLPGERRQRVQVALATIERRREIHGSLAMWPLAIATQVFAVAFNVGVLGALLAHVPTHELRFGWQTTLEVGAEEVASVVEAVAMPWQWAPFAHPTGEQIVATRFAPGQSLATLPGESARAWWPFLAYAVGCYGLVLRAAVLFFAAWRLRSGLRSLSFDHAEANALWRRLTGPLVVAPGPGAVLNVPADSQSHRAPSNFAGGACHLLAATECGASDEELAGRVEKAFGLRVGRTFRVKIDSRSEDAAQIAAVAGDAARLAAVVVAVPAERDPIVAIALFLREVVQAAAKAETIVWLVGEGGVERRRYWRDFAAIQRLPVAVELAP